MLMSLDHNLKDPSEGITMWPKWPQLLQCPAENISDHPWCKHGQDSNRGDWVPKPSDEGQMDGEQAAEQRVDKGKQPAHEVSSNDTGPSEPVAPEEGRGHLSRPCPTPDSYPVTPVASQHYSSTPVLCASLRSQTRTYPSVKCDPLH